MVVDDESWRFMVCCAKCCAIHLQSRTGRIRRHAGVATENLPVNTLRRFDLRTKPLLSDAEELLKETEPFCRSRQKQVAKSVSTVGYHDMTRVARINSSGIC